jgi:hypothetical protein
MGSAVAINPEVLAMRAGWLVPSLLSLVLAACWHPGPREGPEPAQPTADSDGDGTPDQRDACPWLKDPCPSPLPSPKPGDWPSAPPLGAPGPLWHGQPRS